MAKAKEAKASDAPEIGRDQLEEWFRQMVLIRAFEKKAETAFRKGEVGGYMHVYIGMEATATGFNSAIRAGYDNVISAYRIHAMPLLMGSDPVRAMAEIMGRSDGYAKGKGGSMHIYDPDRRFWGGWGIVGGHTPLAAGLAFASKYREEDRVTLCYLGDGAANAGVFFETLNMASLWDLPVVFIIENNEFAMGTRLEHHAADPELHKRGEPFDIEHERIDGMDVLWVYENAKRIIDYTRESSRPYVVEVMNYRFHGHGAADNDRQLYRTEKEEKEAEERDPILLLKNHITKARAMTEEKMEAIEEETLDRVDEIYAAAQDSPQPELEEVYSDVYSDMQPERGH